MKLKELKRKLYKPGAEFEKRPREPEIFEPGQEREKIKSEEWQRTEKKKLTPQQKKYLLVGGISLLVVILALVGLWYGLTSFDRSQVKLEILGPERAVSGDEITYTVKYKNNTRVTLTDMTLVFYYPEESLPLETQELIQELDLADLEPGQVGQIELKTRIIGLKDSQKIAQAKLIYQPANINSRFENQAEFSTRIISVPLMIDFDLPERLVSGQSFSFSLEYLNQAEVSFDDLWLRLEYPSSFNFQSAEPGPLERDNLWSIGGLMAGQEGKVFVRGTIEGHEGEVKSFKAQLGIFQNDQFVPYTETVAALQISVSPLSVFQTVNGATDYIAQAGEVLHYQIDYENTTDVGIKGVVITAKLEGSALDLASLKSGQGSFDGVSQTIIWNASNLPALEFLGPHQAGQIKFSVKVKDPSPIFSYTDKNFIVINTVRIDSSQAPLSLKDIQIAGESRLETKIASRLSLQAKGYFRDDLISNSGPMPPKVGQTTTYTIKWQLSNSSNDLKDVRVEAYLPPHVQWMNKIEPAGADLKYQPQTGQLTWSIGSLPAATGLLLPVKQVAFQVAITPSLAHLGNLVELIGQSRAFGQDTFTGLEITSTDEPIDTDLPDDPTIKSQDGIVGE
jgi:hypothetical protein